jgi:predicted lipoprotein with Yx(FWY)xxD motif
MKEHAVKHLRLSIVVFASVSFLAAGVGSSLAAAHSVAAGVKVGVARTGLGRILVDGRGRTLYLFEKDTRGTSRCAGACAALWPPLIASGRPLAVTGARAGLVGTTKRADGRLQVTYDRHPLYTFFKDTRKGSTKGEGLDVFGAEWYAVSPAGVKVEKDGTPVARSSTDSSGNDSNGTPRSGAYGY